LDLAALETDARYGWVDATIRSIGSATAPTTEVNVAADATATGPRSPANGLSWMDRVDGYLTHGLCGGLFFLVIMFALFYAVFQVAEPAGTWVDAGLSFMNGVVEDAMEPGVFRDLLSEGVIGGVGNFVVFLPQIFILFLFIGLLESTGYMARAAFLMDRVFSPLGLSGKSFVPLLSSFACAIPGIMATRIIERPRDRLLTIMIAPLMSCSARLPVYSLMISTLFPGQVWSKALILLAMYLLGVLVALVIVAIWKKLIWREGSPEFLLELPEFQFPQVWDVLRRAGERSWEFVVRAGTVIMALTILIWAANYFPRNEAMFVQQREQIAAWEAELAAVPSDAEAGVTSLEEQINRLELEITARRQEHSYLGQAGKWIAPVVKPLGWDWRIGCAALASFPAREVIVTTLGILYEVQDPEENVADLELALKQATWPESGLPVFTIPVALSIMVFFALCSQCASTLAVIYQETRSAWWPILSFVYMTVLAYLGAWLTYQVGTWWLA
jgi:ferrous iron transport protein B